MTFQRGRGDYVCSHRHLYKVTVLGIILLSIKLLNSVNWRALRLALVESCTGFGGGKLLPPL